jgi:serine/threonine-protein kinase
VQYGRYEVVRELGRGGMATVFLARDPRFRRNVAIKVIAAGFSADPQFQRRFDREARAIAALEHAAIVPVYDYGEEGGQPYLVFRYMDGGSLAEHLSDHGPMEPAAVIRIVERVARALDYAHTRNIVHRDVKPANILFDSDGEAFLTDFGVASMAEGTVSVTSASAIGSPSYMSPEQCDGQPATGASDVYSLACTVFESLAGRPPFVAQSPIAILRLHMDRPAPDVRTLAPAVPEHVALAISHGLAKSPEARPASAAAFLSELRGPGPVIDVPPRQPRTIITPPVVTPRPAPTAPPPHEPRTVVAPPSPEPRTVVVPPPPPQEPSRPAPDPVANEPRVGGHGQGLGAPAPRRPLSRRNVIGAIAGSAVVVSAGALSTGLLLSRGGGDDDDALAGDDDEAPTSTGTSTSPSGTATATSTVVAGTPLKGGVLRYPFSIGGDSLDPYKSPPALVPAALHYSRVLRTPSGPDFPPTGITQVEGDIADVWEQVDLETLVLRVRNASFHNKAPVNGRAVTAEDVAASWNAFAQSLLTPSWKAMVETVVAVDSETLQLTLAQPYPPLVSAWLTDPAGLWILPAELVGSSQLDADAVGTGPWMLQSYEAASRIDWARHPDYYGAESYPHFDGIEGLAMSEETARNAMLAGELDHSGALGLVYGVDPATWDSMQSVANAAFHGEPDATLSGLTFGRDSLPFVDPRARQALSLAIDRATMLQEIDPTGMGDAHSHFTAALAPFWTSPLELGAWPNGSGRWWPHEPATAKQLLAAAGLDGFSFDLLVPDLLEDRLAQVVSRLIASFAAVEMDVSVKVIPYGTYITQLLDGTMPESSVAVGPIVTARRDPDLLLFDRYHSAGRYRLGEASTDLDSKIERSRGEFDIAVRSALLAEIQQDLAELMPFVPLHAPATVAVTQPWLHGYYHKAGAEMHADSISKSWLER